MSERPHGPHNHQRYTMKCLPFMPIPRRLVPVALVLVGLLLAGCPAPPVIYVSAPHMPPPPHIVGATFVTQAEPGFEIDSMAVWHGAEEHLLIVSAKTKDLLMVYDAATGTPKGSYGGSGAGLGQLWRPNGLAVIDDYLFVVERDNHRVHVFALPSFEPLGMFGGASLVSPYGITLTKSPGGAVIAFVTDNYLVDGRLTPPLAELDHRVHRFVVVIDGTGVAQKGHTAFGATDPVGALREVESLVVDPYYNRLLIADEAPGQQVIKVYDLEGSFTGTVVGKGTFEADPEGIALVGCDDGSGYWIATDQLPGATVFHLFDRETFAYQGAFTSSSIAYTDGIAFSHEPFGPFEAGALFAANDDVSVGAVSWATVALLMDLQATCGM